MYVVYSLSCSNNKEAILIAKRLISLHLVVCTKRIKAASLYPWKGKVEEADEVLLMMDGRQADFEVIEKEIRKLHSYETFVLVCSPISQISKDAKEWMEKELR